MRHDARVTWHFNTKILFAAKFCSQCRAPGLELQYRNPGLQCLCCWGQKVCPEISPGKCHSDGMTWRPWVYAERKMAEQSVGGVNTECRWGWMMFSKAWSSAQNTRRKNHLHLFCLQRQSDIFWLLSSTYWHAAQSDGNTLWWTCWIASLHQ